MNKTTLPILVLLLSTMLASAQINLNENFNNSSLPSDWDTNGNFAATPVAACEGSSVRDNLWTESTLGLLYSPNTDTQSTGTPLEITFDYKIVDYVSAAVPNQPTQPGWGSMEVQHSLDDGDTWVTSYTIDDSNHVTSNSCATVSYTLPAEEVPSASNFKLRFKTMWESGDYYIYIDNVFAVQDITSVPNCDALLTTPADGETNALTNGLLEWAPATGGAIGYKLSLGTTPGGNDVADQILIDNGDTFYDFGNFEENTTHYVQIVPYNNLGNATGCTEYSFTTRDIPDNDACPGAIEIQGSNYTNTQDASNATNNNGFVNSNCGNMNNGVWYTFTGDGGEVTITLDEASNWGAALGLYTGNCNLLNCEEVEETVDGSLSITFPSVLETTYYINVGNASGTVDNQEGTYTITYESIVNPCPEPSNIEANNITSNFAGVTWVENGTAVEWDVEYGEQGFIPGNGLIIHDNDAIPGVSLLNLTPDTTYDVYVTAVCPPDGESAQIGPISFTTLEDPEACADPSDIVTEVISNSSVEVMWTENGSASQWEVQYGEEGFDPATEGTNITDDDDLGVTITGLEEGQAYDVYVTAICGSVQSSQVGPETFIIESISVPENTFTNFSMYPNPTSNIVNLEAESKLSKVALFDLNGRSILKKQPKAKTTSFSVENLAAGIYLVKVQIENTVKTYKLVKE